MKCCVRISLLVLVFSSQFTTVLLAESYIAPPEDLDLIGELRQTQPHPQESLVDVALRKRIGQTAIVLANPEYDRWSLNETIPVILPTRYIVPDATRSGIILNLPEYRLYYFQDATWGDPPLVSTYAVSIGRQNWQTPLGLTTITSKTKNPVWTPPDSIRQEALANGSYLPEVVPAGPDNPLGSYALRLSMPGYLLHGTNRPQGIGMRVTHGCIRMYPQDVAQLFHTAPVDTPVKIVNQPIKVGWHANKLFLEVHPPLEETMLTDEELISMALLLINAELHGISHKVRSNLIRSVVRRKTGIPTVISREG